MLKITNQHSKGRPKSINISTEEPYFTTTRGKQNSKLKGRLHKSAAWFYVVWLVFGKCAGSAGLQRPEVWKAEFTNFPGNVSKEVSTFILHHNVLFLPLWHLPHSHINIWFFSDSTQLLTGSQLCSKSQT